MLILRLTHLSDIDAPNERAPQTLPLQGSQDVATRLRQMAMSRRPHEKLPTKVDLSALLGTSKATVENALRVLESENVIYRRRGSGIYVSPQARSRQIRILISAEAMGEAGSSPFWGILWSHVMRLTEQRALEQGDDYTVHIVPPALNALVHHAGPETVQVQAVARHLRTGRVDGVIGIGVDQRVIGWLYGPHVPASVFAAYGECGVFTDSEDALRVGLTELVMQGCRRIDVWPYPRRSPVGDWPGEAGARAIVDRLMTDTGAQLWPGSFWRGSSGATVQSLGAAPLPRQEIGYRTAIALFARWPKASGLLPDGLYISDDMVTDGAMMAFDELGIRVGVDMMVVTHANRQSPVLFRDRKKLTRIEFNPEEMAQGLFMCLDTALSGQESAMISIKPRVCRPH